MKKTYLYQFFATYPDRIVTADELFEAVRLISVTREQLAGMIADGIADGWLTVHTVKAIDSYSLNHDHNE